MSFHTLLYHVVFSTKYRTSSISTDVERDVYHILYHQLLKFSCYVHRIGGMPDHVHILMEIPPNVAVSEVIKIAKQESTKEIRQRGIIPQWSGWEEGYGVFSYSRQELAAIKQYIANQKEHHRKVSFIEEYRQWLIENGVDPAHPFFPKE